METIYCRWFEGHEPPVPLLGSATECGDKKSRIFELRGPKAFLFPGPILALDGSALLNMIVRLLFVKEHIIDPNDTCWNIYLCLQ
jgi:hypothetical protein